MTKKLSLYLNGLFLVICTIIPHPAVYASDYAGLVLNVGDKIAQMSPSSNSEISQIVVDATPITSNSAYFTLASVSDGQERVINGGFKWNNGSAIQEVNIPDLGAWTSISYVAQKGGHINIKAVIKSARQIDRGWKLALHIPLLSSGWIWQPFLRKEINFNSKYGDPSVASKSPITALTNGSQGFALAVPATSPALVRYYRSNGEMVMEISLGTSPLTAPKANSATVAIQIWRVDPVWGFRSALDDYYARFSVIFKRRNKTSGLWSTATPERVIPNKGFLFHEQGNIFCSAEDSSARDIGDQISTDQAYGLQTYPYVIAGQMSRIGLSSLPNGSTNIDDFLSTETVTFQPQHLIQYNALGLSESEYENALFTSRIYDGSGNPTTTVREVTTTALDPDTGGIVRTWNTIGKSVTFTTNPSPALGENSHGSILLRWVDQEMNSYPDVSGIYVDSINKWSDFPDYCTQHFSSSRFPLVADDTGHVYMPNSWGHYEFLSALSVKLHNKGKLLFGNAGGITMNGTDLFFPSTLPDIVGLEGLKTTLDNEAFLVRTAAGPKTVLRMAHEIGYQDSDTVRKFINANLALGFLPSTWGSYFAQPDWVNSDESFATSRGGYPNYERDKAQWEKVFSILDTFGRALWKPITLAKSSPSTVYVERFAYGLTHYFTVFSSAITQDVSLALDCNTFRNPVAVDLFSGKNLPLDSVGGCFSLKISLPQEENALAIIKVRER